MCKELLQLNNLFLGSIVPRRTYIIERRKKIINLGVEILSYFRGNSKYFKGSLKIAIYDFLKTKQKFSLTIGGFGGNDTCFTYAETVSSRSEPPFVRNNCKTKKNKVKKFSRKTCLKFL